MSLLECPPGSGPPLHMHDLGEVFVCIKGRFSIVWGNRSEHSIELGPLDTFSVPLGIMRRFDNVGDEPGTLRVIYDGGGEILGAISKPPDGGLAEGLTQLTGDLFGEGAVTSAREQHHRAEYQRLVREGHSP